MGAWVPIDAKTRAEGGTTTNRKGDAYLSESEVGRHLENVTGSSASTMLDIDKIPVERWVELVRRIREDFRWSGESWSTASYDPSSGLVSARLHLHLDRELTSAAEIEAVRRSIALRIGVDVCDRACFQPVAVFYLPATRGAHFIEHFNGAEIVVDALPPAPAPRTRTREPRPVTPRTRITAADRELARDELVRHATRIALHPDEHIREMCAKGKTYHLGRYVAAGALTEADVRHELEAAIRHWAERLWPGEDNSDEIERRLEQIVYQAIEDGKRDPALPAERLNPKQQLLADIAPDDSVIRYKACDIVAQAKGLVSTGSAAILALPPGTGKTRAALEEIAHSRQDAIVYAPNHALAEEHRRALVALGVPAEDITHEMSPLHRPAGGQEGCERSRASREAARTPDDQASPFAVTVRSAHLNLRATVCPSCPSKDTCPVRFVSPTRARVRLRVHSAYEPVDPGKAKVFLDEEPEPFERVEVLPEHLAELTAARSPVLEALTGAGHAYWTPAQVERERERLAESAFLAEEPDQGFDPGQAYYVRQAALALRAGRDISEDILGGLARSAGSVRLSAAVAKALAERPSAGLPMAQEALEGVRAVLALARSRSGAQRLPGGSVAVVAETPSRRDIRRGYVQLLSATPTPGAYEGLQVFSPDAEDGCDGISREVLYLARSTSTNFKYDGAGCLAAAGRLLAGREFAGRVLVVTFKRLVAKHAETLRGLFPGAEVELRWYGAVAGSNLYEEGAAFEADTIVTIGDYYANRKWLFDHLAAERGTVDPDDLDAYLEKCGREQIAQELAQAHGRARDPRRAKPIQHLHLGRTMPSGWKGRCKATFGEAVEREEQAAARADLQRVLESISAAEVARRLEVDPSFLGKWRSGARPIPERYHVRLAKL